MGSKKKIDEYLKNNNVNIEEIMQQKIEQNPIQNKWKEFETPNYQKNENETKYEENDQYVLQLPDDFKSNKRRGRKRKKHSKSVKNECNEYEPSTKRMKMSQSQTSHSNNMDIQNKENEDEWNWNLWENEKESKQNDVIKQSELTPTQKFESTSPQLTETQKFESQTDLQSQQLKSQMNANSNNTFVVGLVGSESDNI